VDLLLVFGCFVWLIENLDSQWHPIRLDISFTPSEKECGQIFIAYFLSFEEMVLHLVFFPQGMDLISLWVQIGLPNRMLQKLA
jgi:hypothetical protein